MKNISNKGEKKIMFIGHEDMLRLGITGRTIDNQLLLEYIYEEMAEDRNGTFDGFKTHDEAIDWIEKALPYAKFDDVGIFLKMAHTRTKALERLNEKHQ